MYLLIIVYSIITTIDFIVIIYHYHNYHYYLHIIIIFIIYINIIIPGPAPGSPWEILKMQFPRASETRNPPGGIHGGMHVSCVPPGGKHGETLVSGPNGYEKV